MTSFRRTALFLAAVASSLSASFCLPLVAIAADVIRVNGAGASFPAPLYQRWFRDYYLAHPEVMVDYQAIGSGAGMTNLLKKRLDFAGSDLAMSEQEMVETDVPVVQIPMTAGAVVLIYHLEGIDRLRLSREAVAGIFLGTVTHWNDPLIAAANPGVMLPKNPIALVTRADSSGTTFVMTRHLSAISQNFSEQVGVTMTPQWPDALKKRGALLRANGNGGVTALVRAIPGSVGYTQYAYAYHSDISMAMLQNKDGQFVAPNDESFKAAVQSFREEMNPKNLPDPQGAGSYPILTLSWLVVRKDIDDEVTRKALREVIEYGLTEGQTISAKLGYIPLNKEAIKLILEHAQWFGKAKK
ncbi:MAG: phosphate ABC transporter substrate-binding protein PstS [Gammaproteobacteria bacterium]|nr:phosphate ABC transporter substrate-binding protein PstS [Gammaproteobacteria bacterium]